MLADQFCQPTDKFRMMLDSEDIPRNATFKRAGHERFAPKTQQHFCPTFSFRVGQNEGDRFGHISPHRLSYLGGSSTSLNFGLNLSFPKRLFPFVTDQLDGGHLRIFDCHSERGVEDILTLEHQTADVVPSQIPLGIDCEPLKFLQQSLGADQQCIGWNECLLNLQ